jgi:hypothetical protein
MESDHIPRKTKIALTAQLRALNPFVLRQAMEIKLKKIGSSLFQVGNLKSSLPLMR